MAGPRGCSNRHIMVKSIASNCGPCRRRFRHAQELLRRLQKDSTRVVVYAGSSLILHSLSLLGDFPGIAIS